MNDSKLIEHQRALFKVGDIIEYFDSALNKYIKACVIEKNRTRVLVKNCDDHQRWDMCYLSIKLDSRDFVFAQTKKGLSKHELAVGDCVGFSHDGEEIVGSIIRLNQKTVTLITKNQKRWRVSYGFLYTVIEGESGDNHGKLIQVAGETEGV